MRAMNWDALLTPTLTLESGERLTTLREVARVITSHFEATPRWAVLDRAMEAMVRAAESGGRDEIREATRLIAFVLRQWSLL
jgi:hypothetical protein